MLTRLEYRVPSYTEPVASIETVPCDYHGQEAFTYVCTWLDFITGETKVSRSRRPYIVGNFEHEVAAREDAGKIVAHCGRVATKFYQMRLKELV